jgi:hypothetical protein
MDEAEDNVLAFMGFPNDASIVCLVSALFAEQTGEWQVNLRYMSLEAIGAVLRRDEQRAVIEHQAA